MGDRLPVVDATVADAVGDADELAEIRRQLEEGEAKLEEGEAKLAEMKQKKT